MKELSIEEKAKAYDYAINKAKDICDTSVRLTLKEIFPQLQESEDERVWLIKFIQEEIDCLRFDVRDNDDRIKLENLRSSLAWLENQGSQNLANSAKTCKDEQKLEYKVEPKFKVGEWVIDKQGIVHQIANVIENVTDHTYGYDIVGGGYFNDNTEGVRHWTIQDAKDGDILAYDDGSLTIFRYRLSGLDSGLYMSYVSLTDKIEFAQTCAINNVHPATKEQRDLLFQKMKEAGYEWDSEKKELKKIEQNHAWSEEDEKMLDSFLHKLEVCTMLTNKENCWILDKFKFLKERYTWKPSDEQMHYLSWIANIKLGDSVVEQEVSKRLNELLEDLKKLKG